MSSFAEDLPSLLEHLVKLFAPGEARFSGMESPCDDRS